MYGYKQKRANNAGSIFSSGKQASMLQKMFIPEVNLLRLNNATNSSLMSSGFKLFLALESSSLVPPGIRTFDVIYSRDMRSVLKTKSRNQRTNWPKLLTKDRSHCKRKKMSTTANVRKMSFDAFFQKLDERSFWPT